MVYGAALWLVPIYCRCDAVDVGTDHQIRLPLDHLREMACIPLRIRYSRRQCPPF
jgi:hypothetical protein